MFLRWPQITLEAVSLMGEAFTVEAISHRETLSRELQQQTTCRHTGRWSRNVTLLSKGPLEMEANVALPLPRIVSLRCVTEVDGRKFMSARGTAELHRIRLDACRRRGNFLLPHTRSLLASRFRKATIFELLHAPHIIRFGPQPTAWHLDCLLCFS